MAIRSMPMTAQITRVFLVSLLLTSVFFPSIYQPWVDETWMKLRGTSIYNWSTFETVETVICYAVIEISLTTVFMKHPEWRFVRQAKDGRSKPRGMRRPARRLGEILTYIAPLLAMDLTMIKKFDGVSLDRMLESGNYDSHKLVNDTQRLLSARQTFLVPTLHNFSLSSPLQTTRALPTEPPSSRRLALELIVSFFIYDAMFFLFHLSLHLIPPFRHWHAAHHSHDAQLHPQVTNQLSVYERLGLVMLANFSLNVIGAHVLTRTWFVPVFVWLLVEIHSGMDLPWGYEKVLPKGWGGGARKHMKHHNVGGDGFEPFFCWWDGLWDWVTSRGKFAYMS